MPDIEAIVLYCSLDKRFINTCIHNLLKAGVKVRVVYYDRLYGGDPDFIHFYDDIRVNYTMLTWQPGLSPLYLEAQGRYVGLHQSDASHILFIDADEIIEPAAFRTWLRSREYLKYKSIKLSQYLYSIRPTYQLKKKAYNTILCNAAWAKALPFEVEARFNAYWNNKSLLSRWMGKLGVNPHFGYYRGTPFIHHYTNVRSVRDMMKKVSNWSHSTDRDDWNTLASDMFLHADDKQIGGDPYTVVPNHFGVSEEGLYTI